MTNTREEVSDAISFLFGLVRPDSLKPTVILLYSVLAFTAFWYFPTPSPFLDAQGDRRVPRIERFSERRVETGDLALNDSSSISSRPSAPNSIVPVSISAKEAAEISWFDFFFGARKIFAAFVLLGLIPAAIVKFGFREKLADYGVCWGDKRRTFNNILLFVPFMILVGASSGYEAGFYAVYPYNPYAFASPIFFVAHSILYLFFYYSAWEFMFRGFLLRGLEDSVGATTAVWIQVVLSTTLHFGHPTTEVLGCVAGGLLWGFLVFRTRSLLAGWIQHATLGIALDASLIWLASR